MTVEDDEKSESISSSSSGGNNYCYNINDGVDEEEKNARGFRILSMNMKDEASGELLWDSGKWNVNVEEELEAKIPRKILKYEAISREINFASSRQISHLKLVQTVLFKGMCIEEWKFDFGFVIRGSINSWQQIIQGAGNSNMMNPDELSGNVVIETVFYDGNDIISRSDVRLYYV
eukprot:CAMPEP_0172515912 /NCGR_PEP_ID=MMETSP1066-20121228/271934_1 /TAXON_ID=671091 /ORGANISM="Coscinodiscus wailesii, Strain CCMP2513" /LENGTH=175 /DNA_ID=CAMNT_0013297173 /DNA_START=212 /DNA_END=739 /DNA_ORIENTATION=-